MHPNPIFRTTEGAQSLAFARSRSFGVLTINSDPAPLVSHIPILINEDATQIDLHLVRSNPIARVLKTGEKPARLAVSGPDSYISPDWYGTDDQVPTWNYIAVHFVGRLELQPMDTLRALLDRQSAHFEQQLLPKPPWETAKMSADILDKMMRAIVPVRFHVSDMQSTWKLGQNKPETVRQAAAEHVSQSGIGAQIDQLSEWMNAPPEPAK